MKKTMLTGFATCIILLGPHANAALLDFSQLGCSTGGVSGVIGPTLSFGTFGLSTTSVPFPGFQAYCADFNGYYSGTTALMMRTNSGSVVLTQGGDPFSLNSIGFAQVYTDTGWPGSGIPGAITNPGFVTFHGTTASAANVTQTFQFGRNGGTPAIEQLTFSSDFENVVFVTWTGGQRNNDYWQFAHVDVTSRSAFAVPEPATLLLSIMGLAGVAISVRRRVQKLRTRSGISASYAYSSGHLISK